MFQCIQALDRASLSSLSSLYRSLISASAVFMRHCIN